jgi:hypothetical protein
LKRLIWDEEIQGFQSFFFGKIWSGLGVVLLGFAGFGDNLAAPDRDAWRDLCGIRLPNKA